MRIDGRNPAQLRPINVELDYLEYPAGSCLFTIGKTRVLCAVSIEKRVPQFLLGQGVGWLTAEYALLPCSTAERTQREANIGRLSGRTQEIRRFIGRSLRPIIDLSIVGERTFIIDCDVLQADGGTRTAAVNGAFIALCRALDKMMVNKAFTKYPISNFIGAISVGLVNKKILLDLCYEEDKEADLDLNLVMDGNGKIIEVQATAEHMPITQKQLDKLIMCGSTGIQDIINLEKKVLGRDIL